MYSGVFDCRVMCVCILIIYVHVCVCVCCRNVQLVRQIRMLK